MNSDQRTFDASAPIRRFVQGVLPPSTYHKARQWLADWIIARAVRRLRRRGDLGATALRQLQWAWGNHGFSGGLLYLVEVIRLIRETPGALLECGSGVTTLIAGALAEHYGFQVYCLEQDSAWATSLKAILSRYGLDRVAILQAPLTRYGDYVWYETRSLNLPRRFTVVICDGPFVATELGEPFYSSWRYGVLEYLVRSDSTFDALLLDDVEDPRAEEVLSRWKSRFGSSCRKIDDSDGYCGIIRIAGN